MQEKKGYSVYSNFKYVFQELKRFSMSSVLISFMEVPARLDKIAGDKSTIFISHRLSTCRFCDEIIVMDKGEIVQRGNHDDLVTKSGKYRELWLAQARHYADKADIS